MKAQEDNNTTTTTLEQIYCRYFDRMTAFAERTLGSNIYAEDTVQDVFTAMFQQDLHFITEQVFVNFLYRSIYNKCIDLLRRKQLSRKYEDIYMEENKNTSVSASSTFQYKELSEIVDNRIERLPRKCKQIFIMKYRSGKSNPEISDSLGLSVKTIENQVFIARNVLREYLQSYLCS